MLKLCAGFRNTHKEGQLVRIVARSRHPDSAGPVVVEVFLLLHSDLSLEASVRDSYLTSRPSNHDDRRD